MLGIVTYSALYAHVAPPILTDVAPSWSALRATAAATPTGKRLARDLADPRGPPHAGASLRLFDAADESDVRVTLYRDSAAWCPYCQKAWLFLEEKRIPYRVERVPLNAYGYKPQWYSRKVDGGKLPALELDGAVHVESLEIIKLLDAEFAEPRMVPEEGSADARRAASLLELEERLMRDWFSLVFYPIEGSEVHFATVCLNATLHAVDEALGETAGPWFLGGPQPSYVDLQYLVSLERLLASCLYWKGLRVLGGVGGEGGEEGLGLRRLAAWLAAMESRESYVATQSDYYTLVMSLPSQNGPGYAVPAASAIAARLSGLDGAWSLEALREQEAARAAAGVVDEPLAPLQRVGGAEAARHEAAYRLAANAEAVARFAARGASEPGRPAFAAELADPNAEANEEFVAPIDCALRHVAAALLDGAADGDGAVAAAARADLVGSVDTSAELMEGWDAYDDAPDGRPYYYNEYTGESMYTPPTGQLDACLAYLRDRVGVPRDMGAHAARHLRATLNWAIELARSEEGESE